MGYSVAAILASLSAGSNFLPKFASVNTGKGGVAKRLRRTGKLYPHSSKRQQARYARNIAAGRYDVAQFRR